jgi:hypothetical protein
MDSDLIRTTIRRKLADSDLPHNGIPRFWGGPSDGEDCDACEEFIGAEQLVMEAISTTTNQGIQFHVECFYIWDTERTVPGRDAR